MKNIRVLITDDMPQVRQGLSTMLRLVTKNIYPKIQVVGEAQNGDEAVQQARLLHPDAILMDLEMPVMDGYTATQLIKANDPSIFIIVLTIHDNPDTRKKAKQAGVDEFIAKSAPPEGIVRAIMSARQADLEEAL